MNKWIKLSGAESGMTKGNAMAIDALVPCVTVTSATMALSV